MSIAILYNELLRSVRFECSHIDSPERHQLIRNLKVQGLAYKTNGCDFSVALSYFDSLEDILERVLHGIPEFKDDNEEQETLPDEPANSADSAQLSTVMDPDDLWPLSEDELMPIPMEGYFFGWMIPQAKEKMYTRYESKFFYPRKPISHEDFKKGCMLVESLYVSSRSLLEDAFAKRVAQDYYSYVVILAN